MHLRRRRYTNRYTGGWS